MSNLITQDKHELAKVLSRINALTQNQPVAPVPIVDAPSSDIPVLTEVYVGEAVAGVVTAQARSGVPTLNEEVTIDSVVSEDLVDRLLLEMAPKIKSLVKDAVMQELVNAKKTVVPRLEKEVMQLLRQHLEAVLKQ
ncbi:hypothetical protein A7981_09800 [Methylovorus sp. MM2]|uniref:hypothetical protein n=1 Tax=Methylovorus sp. MM2 TaxID=1848038 RepID=UPI0007DFEB0C|nr:hypothetical protein [Methylovorus sp. MM2]OAM51751.1 hypothetical protein A7981_09800 [Methylovorus sp. MM2]